LGIMDKVRLVQGDVTDFASMLRIVQEVEPDEVYHLAAQSQVAVSFESPLATLEATGVSTAVVLEAIRLSGGREGGVRFYFAGSSEMFGNTTLNARGKIDEACPFRPASPYAAAKVLGCHLTRIYREAYGMHAVCGILFNHESELRGLEFVTRKISNAVARSSSACRISFTWETWRRGVTGVTRPST